MSCFLTFNFTVRTSDFRNVRRFARGERVSSGPDRVGALRCAKVGKTCNRRRAEMNASAFHGPKRVGVGRTLGGMLRGVC